MAGPRPTLRCALLVSYCHTHCIASLSVPTCCISCCDACQPHDAGTQIILHPHCKSLQHVVIDCLVAGNWSCSG